MASDRPTSCTEIPQVYCESGYTAKYHNEYIMKLLCNPSSGRRALALRNLSSILLSVN